MLHSPQAVLYFAPSPPLYLKLGLTNQLMNLLYMLYSSYEKMLKQLLGTVLKRYHTNIYEGWKCTKINAMLPSSCSMILQTLEALNNVCCAAFERQL